MRSNPKCTRKAVLQRTHSICCTFVLIASICLKCVYLPFHLNELKIARNVATNEIRIGANSKLPMKKKKEIRKGKRIIFEMDKVKCMYTEMFWVSVFNSFTHSFSRSLFPRQKYVKFGHVYYGKGRTTHPRQPYTSFFTHFQIIQACKPCFNVKFQAKMKHF